MDDDTREDAALDDENSESEDDSTEDVDAEDLDDDSVEEDATEDDDAPVSRKEFRTLTEKLDKVLQPRHKDRERRNLSNDRTRKPNAEASRLDRLEEQQRASLQMEKKRTFGYENALSPKEVDLVFKLSKRPTAKFLNEPHVKGAIEAMRAADGVNRNTPSTGGRNFQVQGKPFNELSAEDKEANLAERRRAILGAKGK